MNRPRTGSRPFSRSGVGTSAPIGTAAPPSRMQQSRMGTAMRMAGGVGVTLNQDVNIDNRPVTREGMFGMGMKGSKGERQIKDKSYWIGLLNAKITQLDEEKSNLIAEAEKLQRFSVENETLTTKKNNMTKIVEDLRAEFKDLNLAVELMQKHTDEPLEKISKMKSKLEMSNSKKVEQVNEIFKHRTDKESEIRDIEEAILRLNESLDNELDKDPDLKERYYDARDSLKIFEDDYRKKKMELKLLEDTYTELQQEVISSDPEKRRYFEKLQERDNLEKRKQQLNAKLNGGEDMELKMTLKNQVAQDKEEVQLMQKQLATFKNDIADKNKEIKALMTNLDAFKGDRAKKFNELKEKDEVLTNFITNFNTEKEKVLILMNDHQQMIVQLLEHIGRNMSDKENLPSQDKLVEMREDLAFKKEQKDLSVTTLERLEKDLAERKKELEKVKNLGEKIDTDLKRIQERFDEMNSELEIFNDIEAVKDREKREIEELKKKRFELQILKDTMEKRKSDMSKINEQTKRKLQRDEIHSELSDMDSRVRVYQQNNFALQEYIKTRGSEIDYSDLKASTISLSKQLNTKIIEQVNDGNNLYL